MQIPLIRDYRFLNEYFSTFFETKVLGTRQTTTASCSLFSQAMI